MKYGVLTQEGSFLDIAPQYIVQSSGAEIVLISIKDAVEWLQNNSESRLIITMPLNETQRENIAVGLFGYFNQCIALDPEILLSGSSPRFKDTRTLQVGILGQIKEIIAGEAVFI